MKKTFFVISIILIALAINRASAQDFEPIQIKVRYGQDSIFMNTNDSRFKERKFMLGWHWGNGPTLSRALKMSQVHDYVGEYDATGHIYTLYPANIYADSIELVMNAPIIGHNWSKFNLSEGISMQWEPTLKIENEGEFKTNEGDSTNPVFGFKTVIGDTITDANGNKRLLLDSRIAPNTIVLKDNWPNDEILQIYDPSSDDRKNDTLEFNQSRRQGELNNHLRYRPIMNRPLFYRDFNGTDLYLSINLRREDSSTTVSPEDVIKIQIKAIKNNGQTSLVTFSEIPQRAKDSILNLANSRGKIRLTELSSSPNVLYITRSMLPIYSDSGRKDITISAKMIFDGKVDFPNYHNPRFRTSYNDKSADKIKSLSIEVQYLDTTIPISIDWIRIESKVAQDVYRGVYDSVLTAVVRRTIEHCTSDSFRFRGIRPFRFYLRDEHLPMHWGIHRYMQKLIGNVCQIEVGFEKYPEQRMHNLKLSEYWAAFGMRNLSYTPVPYVKYGYNWDGRVPNKGRIDSVYYSSFGFHGGYLGNYYSAKLHPDSTNFNNLWQSQVSASRYETVVDDFDKLQNGLLEDYYNAIEHEPFSLQTRIESKYLFYIFKGKIGNNNNSAKENVLFSGKPWWAEMWIGNDLKVDTIPNINDSIYVGVNKVQLLSVNGLNRPFSGEEISLQLWQPLILGAKGLIYDLESSILSYPRDSRSNWGSRIGIWNSQRYFDGLDTNDVPVKHRITDSLRAFYLNNLDKLVYSDSVGSDWIYLKKNSSDQTDNWDYIGLQNYLPKYENMKWILGIETPKLYIGRRSVRTSLLKIHTYIRKNQDTLLNLQLRAWLGKGFRRWYLQDEKLESEYINKFIRTFNTTTRPIGRKETIIYDSIKYEIPYYEQGFANFIDTGLDSGFYDITLLSHQSDLSMVNNYYLGIQNRRTDPLVYVSGSEINRYNLDTIDFKSGYNFLPTAKFDELVNFGVIFTDTTAESRRRFFDTLWWKRLGAREISINLKQLPSKKIDLTEYFPQQPIRFTIVNYGFTIKELGLTDTNWYMQKPYNHRIDTIVNNSTYINSRRLNVNLLPGQGKILQIIPEYYIQTKRYLPEYILLENYSPCTTENKSYLRTSVKFKGTTCDSLLKTQPIIGELPVTLTHADWDMSETPEHMINPKDTTFRPCTSKDLMLMTTRPAKFVYRRNYVNGVPEEISKLYLVWNGLCYCTQDSTEGSVFINVGNYSSDYSLPCDTNFVNYRRTEIKFPDSSLVIGGYSTQGFPSRDPSFYGTTINASKERNYVAWTDAQQGIGIGWMYPQDSIIRGTTYIPFVMMPNIGLYNCLLNPEFNRYSRISLGEDECALVFEGRTSKTLDDSTNQIFYTRVKVDTLGNIETFLPQLICNQTSSLMTRDASNKICMVTAQSMGRRHQNARIIRNVAHYTMPNVIDNLPNGLSTKMDRIVWESVNPEGRKMIQIVGYDFQDSMEVTPNGLKWHPNCYFTRPTSYICSIEGNVQTPSIAQGAMKLQEVVQGLDTFHLRTFYNDSAMVMAFSANDSLIYQLPQNFWSLMQGMDYTLDQVPNLNLLSSKGYNPSITTIPSVKDDSLYRYIRIFYETDSSNESSTQYFYKQVGFNDKHTMMFGYNTVDGKSQWFSPIMFMDEKGITTPRIKVFNENNNQKEILDTITTEWFTIGQIKDMHFIEKGNLTTGWKMQLQRKSDKKQWDIVTEKLSNKNYNLHKKLFINGKNDEYRIMWYRTNQSVQAAEMLVIGNIPAKMQLNIDRDEGLGKMLAEAEDLIDLSGESYAGIDNRMKLIAYPNPAREELNVIVYLPKNEIMKRSYSNMVKVKLFNLQGEVFYETKTKAGEIIKIQTEGLPKGAYYLQAINIESERNQMLENLSIIIE